MICLRVLAPLTLVIGVGINSTAAVAGSDDKIVVSEEQDGPALMVLRDAMCKEDYESELRDAGLSSIRVNRYLSLRDLARFLGFPKGIVPQHLLIAGGYVFADHVAPTKVLDVLRTKPNISGLVGSGRCPDGTNHQAIHNETPRELNTR